MRPPVDGVFSCDKKECDFKTSNIFEFLEHCGVEFGWQIFLNKKYSFDFFTFLQHLTMMVDEGDLDAIYDHVQMATLLMVNASDGEIEEFIQDSIVREEVENGMSDIEKFLKENK